MPFNSDEDKRLLDKLREAYNRPQTFGSNDRLNKDDDRPEAWIVTALLGDPVSKTVIWSGITRKGNPITFSVTGDWAKQIAEATSDYIDAVVAIYDSYLVFQQLEDEVRRGSE